MIFSADVHKMFVEKDDCDLDTYNPAHLIGKKKTLIIIINFVIKCTKSLVLSSENLKPTFFFFFFLLLVFRYCSVINNFEMSSSVSAIRILYSHVQNFSIVLYKLCIIIYKYTYVYIYIYVYVHYVCALLK